MRKTKVVLLVCLQSCEVIEIQVFEIRAYVHGMLSFENVFCN